jgi:membrane protein DedA with SNARE-associated domain
MLEELLRWVEHTGGPLPYVVLALAGASEYVAPFLPGDSVTLFGAFLATTTGRHPLLVYGAINAGSLAGALLAYAFGRWTVDRPHHGRILGNPHAKKAIAIVQERFARHGAVYLAINRFVPGIRAFFFVAAGMIRMPVWQVVLYGGISAFAWNALIMLVAWLVGDNFALLQRVFRQYTAVSLALIAAVFLFFAARWAWRRRRAGEPTTDDLPAPGPSDLR